MHLFKIYCIMGNEVARSDRYLIHLFVSEIQIEFDGIVRIKWRIDDSSHKLLV